MAFCMQCSREVPDLTIECPHCGHDFLGLPKTGNPGGWEYSGLADIVLLMGAAASGLASVFLSFVLLGSVIGLLGNLNRWQSHLLIVGQLSLGLCMAMANLVVFLRVANLSQSRSGGLK